MLPRQRENSFVSVGRTFQGRKALKQFVAAGPVLRHIVAKSPTRLGQGLPHYRGVNCVPGTRVPSRPGTFPPCSLPPPSTAHGDEATVAALRRAPTFPALP